MIEGSFSALENFNITRALEAGFLSAQGSDKGIHRIGNVLKHEPVMNDRAD